MGISISFKCDRCGVERGPSNHWYMALFTPGARISVLAFNEEKYRDSPDSYQIFCGQEHVMLYVSENLASLHNFKDQLKASVQLEGAVRRGLPETSKQPLPENPKVTLYEYKEVSVPVPVILKEDTDDIAF